MPVARGQGLGRTLSPRAPDLATRVRERECLNLRPRMRHLKRVFPSYVEHYNQESPHSGAELPPSSSRW
jgi:hypothetical protein